MAINILNTIPNPFAGIFARLTPKSIADQEKAMERNSFGVSEVEEKTAEFLPQGSQFLRVGQTFESFFSNKSARVHKYRAMSKFPEIMDAIDTILNEAIVEDKNGIVVKFDTIQGVELPARVRKQVDEIAAFVFNEVVRVRKNLAPLFKRFLIEGELYIEKVLNTKKNGLAGIKMLPPFRIFPLYERGIIQGYVQGTFDPNKRYNKEVDIKFGKNEIAYINYDEYTDGDLYRPEGFLEPASKVWNMLRQMEDAVVIYRLSRASERLMFNIEVGNLSPQKAAAEMNKLINQYRKNVVYDPVTGMVSQNYNSMAMHENYFLPQQDGKGSSITQLPGASNLSELGDINMFTKKLYIALKIPKSRWQDNQMPVYNSRPGEIEREEVKFASFISRLHVLFKPILIDLIITEMKLRGIPEEYLNPDHYDIIFSKNNYYSELKDLQLVEEKLSILNAASPSILTFDNPNGFLSTEFVLKKYFQMSDSDYEENKKFLEKEKKEIEKQRQAKLEAEGMMNTDLSQVNEVPFPEDIDIPTDDQSSDAIAASAEEDVIKRE